MIFVLITLLGATIIKQSRSFYNPDKAMLIFAGTVIVLFCSSIDAISFGTDIMNYYNNVATAMNLPYASYLAATKFERGYATLIWLVGAYLKNPQWLLLIQYSFFNFSVLRFIYKNSEDCFLSLIAYICLGTFMFYFTAFRQATAFAIALFAIECLQERKTIRFVLLICIATLFHKTVITLLPIYFIMHKPISLKWIGCFASVALIVGLNFTRILFFANDLFDMEYVNQARITSTTGAIINLIIFAVVYLFILMGERTQLETIDENRTFLFYMGLIGVALYVMRFRVLAIERLSFYYLPAIIVLVPFALKSPVLTDQSKNLMRNAFLVLSVILFVTRCSHTLGDYVWIW